MFNISESSNDLFRRVTCPRTFLLRAGNLLIESIQFGQHFEVMVKSKDNFEFSLDIISQFSLQFQPECVIIHASTGNFLSTSLLQSGFDVSQMHALSSEATRVKSVGLQSLSQLIALVELLNTSLFQEKTLLILEGVQLILVAQKQIDGQISSSSNIDLLFDALQRLRLKNVIVCWATVVHDFDTVSTGLSSLRDGSKHDSLSVIWKSNIPRLIRYHTSMQIEK